MPLLSLVKPTIKVFQKSLIDALNLSKSKIQSLRITVSTQSSKNVGPFITFGVVGVIFGFEVYYKLPKALLTQDYEEMLNVFLIILLSLFIGLNLLSMNLQVNCQSMIMKVFLFWEKDSSKRILRANLRAHTI